MKKSLRDKSGEYGACDSDSYNFAIAIEKV